MSPTKFEPSVQRIPGQIQNAFQEFRNFFFSERTFIYSIIVQNPYLLQSSPPSTSLYLYCFNHFMKAPWMSTKVIKVSRTFITAFLHLLQVFKTNVTGNKVWTAERVGVSFNTHPCQIVHQQDGIVSWSSCRYHQPKWKRCGFL